MDLIDAALRCKKVDGRFSYVGPTYQQAKATIWMYLKRFTADIPGIEQRESDLMVVLPHNNAHVRLFGADNFERLRGSYSDGLVVDEFAAVVAAQDRGVERAFQLLAISLWSHHAAHVV